MKSNRFFSFQSERVESNHNSEERQSLISVGPSITNFSPNTTLEAVFALILHYFSILLFSSKTFRPLSFVSGFVRLVVCVILLVHSYFCLFVSCTLSFTLLFKLLNTRNVVFPKVLNNCHDPFYYYVYYFCFCVKY